MVTETEATNQKGTRSREMIMELERERDDWANMERLVRYYGYSAGLLSYGGKQERCGLCGRYRKKIGEMVSCRECPIVEATGRTCDYWWRKAGLNEKRILKDEHSMCDGFMITKIFITNLIDRLEKLGLEKTREYYREHTESVTKGKI